MTAHAFASSPSRPSWRARLAMVAGAAALAAASALPASAQIGRQGGPIDITADETVFLDSERVSQWIGKVDVRQGDARLLADRMNVYFAEGADGGPGQIERIEAVGSVAYITEEEVARASRGVYFASSDTIEMCGDVTLVVRGQNTLAGECLVVEPSLGRSKIVGGDRGRQSKERVRGVFFPEGG